MTWPLGRFRRPGKHLATDVRIDASGSQLADDLPEDLEPIIRDAAARTAACSGRLSVRAFAGSSAGTAILFDQTLALHGATETARILQISGIQDDVLDEVSERYKDMSGLRGGSDPVAQARLAGEFLDQLGPDYQLALTVVSDGMQTIGQVDPTLATNGTVADELAAKVDVPSLPGAEITFVGLGNVNGVKESSRVTESLVRFYTALASRMHAGKIHVATDYTSPVGGGR